MTSKGRDLRLSSVPGLTAHMDGQGTIVTTTATQSVVITDIIASATGAVKEDSGSGDTIFTIPVAGHSNLSTPIKVAEGADIFNDNNGQRVTICYYLVQRV